MLFRSLWVWFGLAWVWFGFGLGWLGFALGWLGFALGLVWFGLGLVWVWFGLGWVCFGLALVCFELLECGSYTESNNYNSTCQNEQFVRMHIINFDQKYVQSIGMLNLHNENNYPTLEDDILDVGSIVSLYDSNYDPKQQNVQDLPNQNYVGWKHCYSRVLCKIIGITTILHANFVHINLT